MSIAKKHLGLIISCFVCSALFSTAGATAAKAEEKTLPVSEPLCIYGTIHKEDGRLIMTGIHGDTTLDQLVLNISDETRILDAINGFPVSAGDLQDGETVYAYISQAMALSLPPQSHASMIICRIPADFAAPSFATVESLSLTESGVPVLKTVRGTSYMIDGGTTFLPYLTRNIVTVRDLTKGRTCLIWSAPAGQEADAVNTASKIVIFADGQNSQPAGPASDPELLAKKSN